MSAPYAHEAVSVVRAFLPMLGIVCVNMVLLGAFKVMVCGGNLDQEHHAMQAVVTGVVGSLVIGTLFAAATVTLGKL